MNGAVLPTAPARRVGAIAEPITLPRLAVLRDYREEGWPSMDLCAEMLARHLRDDPERRFGMVDCCPPFRSRLRRLPLIGRRKAAANGDRLLNRMWDYPRHARRLGDAAEAFHIVDHSYAQLVHALPADRTGVYCHDLDTFRCLLEPHRDPRPRWFRAMTRRILGGLQRAAVVFHSTAAVRAEIERVGLVDPARLVHAPLGIAPEFHAEAEPNLPSAMKHFLGARRASEERQGRPSSDCAAGSQEIMQRDGHARFILHVGSCIPRKRIDVLLAVFARLRSQLPGLRLVKIGGAWTAEQRGQIERHGLGSVIVHGTGIERATLAALYRSAALVLMPSEAEGFGLPVVEALACGAPVLASDLPVFREVGGAAIRYVAVGAIDAWTDAALALLREPGPAAPRLAQAARFSWQRHAGIIADAYLRLLQ